ncbi:MAG: uracil-DNA glycosylase, partial [Campylobacterota bacterium]|nr:uracil-DNA glycosylase [Campylobacterota bacterium]
MVHSSWQETVRSGIAELSDSYRDYLEEDQDYFPSKENCFNAFKTLPKERVRYILFGQDPYPREESAIGYAFIDGKVGNIFSSSGLSKEVNKATSLRNFVKMALLARGDLMHEETSQEAIAGVDKSALIENIGELKDNFERNGVLLLNTALVFSTKAESRKHIKLWQPFIEKLLLEMQEVNPTLILFGTHAKALKKMNHAEKYQTVEIEHPYNHSFISSREALKLFGPMDLLA